MYHSPKDAKYSKLHAFERIKDDNFWYPDFGQETTNLRLPLSNDGINPHDVQSNSHYIADDFSDL